MARDDRDIAALSRAATAGDLAAMSAVAHRLLVGYGVPEMPADAVRLLGEAARGGEPTALARLAALTAGGAHVRQDWTLALRLLGQAAAAGDEGARGQLRCLYPGAGDTPDWQGIAYRVPLQDWLRPPQATALRRKVLRVPELMPREACEWLIRRAGGRLERARVYDAINRRDAVVEMRSNTAANFDLASIDVVQFLLQARMSAACGVPLVMFEPPNILHYDVGEQITAHYDFIDPALPAYEQLLREQGQRTITFLLYLNEDYEGGETTFPELGLIHKGTRGEGLYFINSHEDGRPDTSMVHTGSPPLAGEKWIVSQFIRNIRLRA
jgi:hypothetical protein